MMLHLFSCKPGVAVENAVSSSDCFYWPDCQGPQLVAIVVGGLMFAFGEGGNKRMFAGIVFVLAWQSQRLIFCLGSFRDRGTSEACMQTQRRINPTHMAINKPLTI